MRDEVGPCVLLEVTARCASISGRSPTSTVFWYNGSGTPTAAFWVHNQQTNVGFTNGSEQVHLRRFFVLGGNNTNVDALQVEDVNRSSIEDVSAWGASTTGTGMNFIGNVTTSYTRTKVSGRDYAMIQPLITGTHSTPGLGGFNFNSSTFSGNQCTDSTVTDFAAEFLNIGSGVGVAVTSANSMDVHVWNFRG